MSLHDSTSDEFGEDRLLSRLNRRFSDLLPSLLKLPADWREEPEGCFKRHLAKVNLLALSILVVGGIAASVLLMVLAIKKDDSSLFFAAVCVLPAIFLLQYVLSLFCSANLNLAFSTPIHLVSRLVPDVITVASFLGLVVVGVSGGLAAVSSFDTSLQLGLIATITSLSVISLLGTYAWVAANSERLLGLRINLEVKQDPADYLFSIILYLGRYTLVLVSYQFLATVLIAAFGVAYLVIAELIGKSSVTDDLGMVFAIAGAGFVGISQIVWAMLTPVVSHFTYLIFVSIADIGVAFFRLVKSSERIARLSEEAMEEDRGEPEGDAPAR